MGADDPWKPLEGIELTVDVKLGRGLLQHALR